MITLRRIEKLTADFVLHAAQDISEKVCADKELDHEYIIEQTRNMTAQYVDKMREVIYDHVAQTLWQDVSLHILKVLNN